MRIDTHNSTIFISTEIETVLEKVLSEYLHHKKFVLVDENTKKYCLPRIESLTKSKDFVIIETESGENNKTLQTTEKVWQSLKENGADRSSVLLNLGGGIIGDLGGFAASTFKRGMDFINIPTTLLSQVDASVGGKTGVNFLGLKNEIGIFNQPRYVIIDSTFNKTLDKRNTLSGWAEMLKHTLISEENDWDNIIGYDIRNIGYKDLNQLIARSVKIKNYFVEKDPKEKDIRKALNFGHTFGHAFESLFMNTSNKILHGEAVAHGMVCELYLSSKQRGFPKKKMQNLVQYILSIYPKLKLQINFYNEIFDLIAHDKKNEGVKLNFTLLEDFGKLSINTNCTKEDMVETLNWYSSL